MGDNVMKYVKEGMTYKYQHPNIVTGGSCDPRYCYSVWMRHLIFYYEIRHDIPRTVIEFGPGDTIGTGLMALLCGANEYYALDFMHYSGNNRVFSVFNRLLTMLQKKTDIPGEKEFPNCTPRLKSYAFPGYILTDEILKECLSEARIREIKKNIEVFKLGRDAQMIHYLVPWWENEIKNISGDLIFSQAVFEHIDDYKNAHQVVGRLAKQGTVISHDIDFDCHMCADRWNGHWAYDDLTWKMIYGSRPYFLNRIPLSVHIREMQKAGIKIQKVIRTRGDNGILPQELSKACSNIRERDIITKNAYVVGVKTESN